MFKSPTCSTIAFLLSPNLSLSIFFTLPIIIPAGYISLSPLVVITSPIENLKSLSIPDTNNVLSSSCSSILLIIFFAPAILFSLDYYNIFSKLFPQYGNLSREYDWLSFIGTYAGTIVSSILLIFITEKDRNENTAVLRTSQRPYLDISYMKIDNKFFEKDKDKVIIFNHGKSSDKSLEKDEYLTLCIKNNGASVAIIDTNKTKVKLQYIIND